MQSEGPGYGEGSSLYHLKNLNPLYISLKKYVVNITSVASVIDAVRSYDISIIGRSDLNGNSNLYGYLNVTHSISKHHSHYHRHSSGRNTSEVESTTRHVDVEDGIHANEVVKEPNDVSTYENHRTDVSSQGLLEAIVQKTSLIKKTSDADRSKTPAKQANFHSAHYYEHRDVTPVMNYENNNLVVEVKKDFEEFSANSEISSNKPLEIDKLSTGTVGVYARHKYAGLYRKVDLENVIKKTRDVRESLEKSGQHVKEKGFAITDAESTSANRVFADSSEPNVNSNSSSEENQTSLSTNSPENTENQTRVTQRSQYSSSNSSNQSGSLSSTDKSSSSSIDSNYHDPKTIDQLLRAQSISMKSITKAVDSYSIETKFSPKNQESLLENSSHTDIPSRPMSDLSPTPNAHDFKTEHTPKIDIQFKSSKHLLHSKPNMDVPKGATLGVRFLNSSKHFRGIIDVKIAQGNDDFIAISGPPYYHHKENSNRSNFTASAGNSTAAVQPNSTSSPQELAGSRESRANVEPFQWSTSYIRHQKHVGHPDLWNFDVFKATWVWS